MTVIRGLKRRFGIAAPRVAVRTHAPWYLRWGLMAIAIAGVLGVAWVTYDTGRNLAGFQSSEAAAEHARLSEEVTHLRDENGELRSQLAALERQLVVDLVEGGEARVMVLPAVGEKPEPYRLNFKFYQRVEGVFRVPPDAAVKRVQVRVLEDGSEGPRSTQTVDLS